MKVSLITVVYNGEQFLRDCIESVITQNYQDIEYILIDGNSTDKSYAIANEYQRKIDILISEPDKGMYDAINKGINLASGEIIGILNADDILAASDVISQVVNTFKDSEVDAIYGDLNYVNPNDITQIQRKWRSKQVNPIAMSRGWMPAHPTFYARKDCYLKFKLYSLDYGSAADYELMLRFIYKNKINILYLPVLMVNMRNGGMSNATFKHRFHAFKNDLKALQVNGVPFSYATIFFKKLSKLKQFL